MALTTFKMKWQLLPDGMVGQRLKLAQSQTGRALARAMQSESLAYHRLGQPYLPTKPHWGVSISHSQRFVAVIVAPQAVGFDIEQCRPLVLTKIKRAFTAAEWAFLQSLSAVEQVTMAWRLWTAKEAVLKLLGCGLTKSPRQVVVQLPLCDRAMYHGQVFELISVKIVPGVVGTLAW